MQLAEFLGDAGASDANELYHMYKALLQFDVNSEHIYYKIAVFIDQRIFGPNAVKVTFLSLRTLMSDAFCEIHTWLNFSGSREQIQPNGTTD